MITKYLHNKVLRDIGLNSIGFIIQFLVIFIVGILLSANLSSKYFILISLVWSFGLVGIGLFYIYKQWYNEYMTIEAPWDISTGGGRMMARPFLLASVVNEFIMGSASCIYRIVSAIKKRKMISGLRDEDYNAVLNYLYCSALTNNRFVKMENCKLDKNVLSVLIAFDIVWTKSNKGDFYVGINRKYEYMIVRNQ